MGGQVGLRTGFERRRGRDGALSIGRARALQIIMSFGLFPLVMGPIDGLMASEWCDLSAWNPFSPDSYMKEELYLAGRVCQRAYG